MSTLPADTTISSSGMPAEAPPELKSRILTDHAIPQIPWWSQRLTLLPPPKRKGALGGLSDAWRTVRLAQRYDVFISANVRNALALGVARRLSGRRRPLLVMTEMRLDDPLPGWRWRLKVALQRFAWRAADLMCVSARREAVTYAERLRVPLQQFRFVPWHTNVLEPRMYPAKGNYLFAAGRTGRDWRTLAEAAKGLDAPITIVCSARDAANIAFPPNVTVLTDIPYARYRELLEGAKGVLVPLEEHIYSSGQVVILEAMAMGKAVVSARVLGSEDYIEDGVDGLLVSPGNVAELRGAMQKLLSDPALPGTLGRAALRKVIEAHTLDKYVRTILAAVEELHSR